MRITMLKNTNRVDEIVNIHMRSFVGFFLSFLGKGFLKQLYKGFIVHSGSGIIVVLEEKKIVGFLAYSEDISGFYKFLIKRYLIPLAWYSVIAFFKKPSILRRILRAFTYSHGARREEKYIELSSIGVLPDKEGQGIGSKLLDALKSKETGKGYNYIKLETDSVNNEVANNFYQKNGFTLDHEYVTHEGRKMNEYRYYFYEAAP